MTTHFYLSTSQTLADAIEEAKTLHDMLTDLTTGGVDIAMKNRGRVATSFQIRDGRLRMFEPTS